MLLVIPFTGSRLKPPYFPEEDFQFNDEACLWSSSSYSLAHSDRTRSLTYCIHYLKVNQDAAVVQSTLARKFKLPLRVVYYEERRDKDVA